MVETIVQEDAACGACGALSPSRARFCIDCGAPMSTTTVSAASRQVVTVVFCDLVGSTSLAEAMDPEGVRVLLAGYYERMSGCVRAEGGETEKFIGDAVVAVFGLARVHEDDALRALRTALAMQGAATELHREVRSRWGLDLAVRVGVNTGEVVVDLAGGASRFIASDVTNVAARLQQLAEPGCVVLSEATRAWAGPAVRVVPQGDLQLKGRREAVQAWRLEGVEPRPADRRSRTIDLFVDREVELAQLLACVQRSASERRAVACSVEGEVGIGKTRLAEELVRRVRGTVSTVSVSCPTYGGGGTAVAFSQLLEALEALSGSNGELLRVWRATAPSGDGRSMTRDELFGAIRRRVECVARERPLLIVVDDLHVGGELLRELLEYLTAPTIAVPLTVLTLSRSDAVTVASHPQAAAVRVTLQGLGATESLTLLAALTDGVTLHAGGTLELAAAADQRVVELAGGNPLFIEELVAHGAHRGGDLPPSIRSALWARVAGLGDRERRSLQLASVLGTCFAARDACALARAEGLSDGETLATLSELAERGLLRETGGGRYCFQTGLLREVAYGSIARLRRSSLHRRYSDWLGEERRSEPSATDLEATHLDRAYQDLVQVQPDGEDSEELGLHASGALERAGSGALSRGDVGGARSLLERAQELQQRSRPGGSRTTLLTVLGGVQLLAGEPSRGRANLETALRDASGAGDEVAAAVAETHLAALESDDAEALARTARRTIPVLERGHDPASLARALVVAGRSEQLRGSYGGSLAPLRRAVEVAGRADAGYELAAGAASLALSLALGPVAAEPAAAECRALLRMRASGGLLGVAVSCPLALLLAMSEAVGPAREMLEASAVAASELGHRAAAAHVPLFEADVALIAGDYLRAAGELQRAVAAQRALGHEQASVQLMLAYVLALAGEMEESRAALDRYESGAGGRGGATRPGTVCRRRMVESMQAAARGEEAAALAAARSAVDVADATDNVVLRAEAQVVAAKACAAGRPAAARGHLERAAALAREKSNLPMWRRAVRELELAV